MDQALSWLTRIVLAVGVVSWCVGAWSQLQMGLEIQPWADRRLEQAHRIRIGTLAIFRPDLLTEKGQRHRHRFLIAVATFCATLLIAAICGFLRSIGLTSR